MESVQKKRHDRDGRAVDEKETATEHQKSRKTMARKPHPLRDATGRVGVKPHRRGASPSRVGPLGRDRINERRPSTAMDGERPRAIDLLRV